MANEQVRRLELQIFLLERRVLNLEQEREQFRRITVNSRTRIQTLESEVAILQLESTLFRLESLNTRETRLQNRLPPSEIAQLGAQDLPPGTPLPPYSEQEIRPRGFTPSAPPRTELSGFKRVFTNGI